MNRIIVIVTFILSILMVSLSYSDAKVTVAGPIVRFKSKPKRVLIEKDIYVVPDYDHEVFIVKGKYWTLWKGHWYCVNTYNGKWIKVKNTHVPKHLLKLKPGKYIRYKSHKVKHKKH